MKGKRYSTEDKIRILREGETADRSIIEVCREKGISEQTYHRWKREFGMMKLVPACLHLPLFVRGETHEV